MINALLEQLNNGQIINQDAKSNDYQKYLEDKVLKLNFKSFTQIVVLGSASFVPPTAPPIVELDEHGRAKT